MSFASVPKLSEAALLLFETACELAIVEAKHSKTKSVFFFCIYQLVERFLKACYCNGDINCSFKVNIISGFNLYCNAVFEN